MINVQKIKPEFFLQSETPGEVILAILYEHEGQKSVEIIRQILIKLRLLIQGENELKKALFYLENLSVLRNKQSIIKKKEEAMALTKKLFREDINSSW